MGRRGPPPEPTAIKARKWNPDKQAVNHREPKPSPDVPSCPRWLDKEAKAAWRWLVPQLKNMGVLTRIDGHALTNYCQTWARWRAAEEFLQKHGNVIPFKDNSGRVKSLQPVPQVGIARTLLHDLRRYQQEFGMTPSARTRIMVDVELGAALTAESLRAELEMMQASVGGGRNGNGRNRGRIGLTGD